MADLRTALAPLVHLEPRSTLALAGALSAPSPRHVRVLTAGPGGRSICTVVRSEPGVWNAHPVLARETDAAEMARAIDRSVAVGVHGDPEDVDAVTAHMQRAGTQRTFPKIVVPWQPIEWRDPDESTRMATLFDLPELVDLFARYEVRFARTARGRRRRVEDAIRRMAIVVVENDGRIDGAMMIGGFTPSYLVWAHMTVRPEARQQGRAWGMVARAAALNGASGLGFVGIMADTNPMPIPDFATVTETATAALSLPDRVPGERPVRLRLHRATRAWNSRR